MLTKDQAIERLREFGVAEGELVMMHMSYKALGPVEGGPETVVDAFVEAVGASGTVLFPTFNFTSWTEGHYWDIAETPSETGVVSELARRRPESVRTPHPIYSFAVIGARAEEFGACEDPEAFGDGSAYARFQELDGLILSIGIPFPGIFSIIHRIELQNGAEYRRIKRFGGLYVDREGRVEPRVYTMNVRRPGVQTATDPLKTLMAEEGVMRREAHRFGEASVLSLRAQEYTDVAGPLVRSRSELLHQKSR